MTDRYRYVIVVEVDNKRALAAFQKGLDDLEVIWPQVMEEAQKSDDLTAKAIAEDDRKYRVRNSFMAELKRHRDIASAATKPYRMTESDALAMIGWENGERMEWVRRNFLRRAEA